tara:strand:+ start:4849 stop:5301 length:453 start_codon:yes stop_codon:yes gene_type:complete
MGITAVISAISATASVVQGNKAAKAQERGVAAQRQQAQSQANRSRRQAIRTNLIARSQLQNQAVAAGVSGGSGFSGGLSSATSQFGANLGYSGVQQGLQNNIFQAQSQQVAAQGRSAAFGSISKLGFQLAGTTFGGQIDTAFNNAVGLPR